MDWNVLWPTWYCLGRQHQPTIVVGARSFETYLALHRARVARVEVTGPVAAQAYLVAAALEGDNEAAAALLNLPMHDGRRLEDCLHRVARRHCAAHADDVVAELLLRWYGGTPQNPVPLLARWPPVGDFCRYWLISAKRLALAESQRKRPLQELPDGLDLAAENAGPPASFRPRTRGDPPTTSRLAEFDDSDPNAETATEFVKCFVERLARQRHGQRRLCVVAIASQMAVDAAVRQKQLAALLEVSEPTVTRDIKAVIAAQETCIELLHLGDEPQRAWWWGDVRAIAAEHPLTIDALSSLLPRGDVSIGIPGVADA